MSLYTIAERDPSCVRTDGSCAASGWDCGVLLLFTEPSRAIRYQNLVGRSAPITEVRRLPPRELLLWLAAAWSHGIRMVAVDPHAPIDSTANWPPLHHIGDLLDEPARELARKLSAPPSPALGVDLERIAVYQCHRCGKVRRQPDHQRKPTCCGSAMQGVSIAAGRLAVASP
ncbi:MAG: hypothetical protein KY476_24655 [Planctomycetes bacterium]|nr:hypothetical protein [Planctomycetota bacterium]